ncbi:MAG: membrane protein insertase YidC [Deltaproteobacteria bacterium]|nr:membrane protein insertase YidC [Deltaproteobacteria bacterium]
MHPSRTPALTPGESGGYGAEFDFLRGARLRRPVRIDAAFSDGQPMSNYYPPGQFSGEDKGNETWRLLVIVGLVTLLWIAWPLIFPSQKPPATPDAGARSDAPVAADSGAGPASSQPASLAATQPESAPASRPAEQFVEMHSTQVAARLSTWGAALVDFKLSDYVDELKRQKDRLPPPVDLVPAKGASEHSFTVRATAGTFPLAFDAAYRIVESNEQRVVMQHDTGRGVLVTRTFKFEGQNHNRFEVETAFENQTDQPHSVVLQMAVTGREREGERSEGGFFAPPLDQMSWMCRTDSLHQQLSLKHETDETLPGPVAWAGIDRHYFLAAMVPRTGQTQSCAVRRQAERGLLVAIDYAPLELPPRQSVTLLTSGYFGPKQLGMLRELQAHVEEAINFGWFGVLARPMLWLLVWFFGFVKNYGLAIILLTIVVKAVLYPVTQKSFESAERMKKLQPLIKELQQKYKADKLMLSQKQMELFKQHHVSPLGGCLPMLLQMPIWIALYRTLYSAVELYQQPFIAGWIDNLAIRDPTYVMPIAVGVVMVVQQLLTPTPADQPAMKYMMWSMPIVFTLFMLSLPSGLALYIFVNSLLSIAQQFYIRRKFAAKP